MWFRHFPGFLLLVSFSCLLAAHASSASSDDDRFDYTVRNDIFQGFTGDEKAMARGMATCDAALAKDPKHAEAMVWRGAARVFQAGQLFSNKKIAEGQKLWMSGLKDMDEAVKLQPNNVGVRVPRAAVLATASRQAPPAMGKPLMAKVVDDLETVRKLHGKDFEQIGDHPRGEVHMGLADVYRRQGESAKSRAELETVVKEMPGTKYAERAKEWLAAKPDAKLVHNCIGCHSKN